MFYLWHSACCNKKLLQNWLTYGSLYVTINAVGIHEILITLIVTWGSVLTRAECSDTDTSRTWLGYPGIQYLYGFRVFHFPVIFVHPCALVYNPALDCGNRRCRKLCIYRQKVVLLDNILCMAVNCCSNL